MYVGGGWRSGHAGDNTGSAATPTVSAIAPTTAPRKQTITLTVTGTGFTNQTKIYSAFNPVSTVFDSATQVRCLNFNTTPDNGQAGVINVGVRNPSQVISGTRPFTAT